MTDEKDASRSKTPMSPNDILGSWISLGAGVGMVIGMFVFDQFMWGLVMGAALGATFGGAYAEQARAKERARDEDEPS